MRSLLSMTRLSLLLLIRLYSTYWRENNDSISNKQFGEQLKKKKHSLKSLCYAKQLTHFFFFFLKLCNCEYIIIIFFFRKNTHQDKCSAIVVLINMHYCILLINTQNKYQPTSDRFQEIQVWVHCYPGECQTLYFVLVYSDFDSWLGSPKMYIHFVQSVETLSL